MKYVIWGVGFRGKRIIDFLGEKNVVAYIDSDINKQGKEILGKQIISYDEYKRSFRECIVIVSPALCEEIVALLEKDGIYHYFTLNEEVDEVKGEFGIREEIMRVPFDYDSHKACIIWGINLYAIFLIEHFRKQGITKLYIVPHKDMSSERREDFKKKYADIYVEDLQEIEQEKANLFLTIKPEKDVNSDYYHIYNAYDFSHLDCYYNTEIEKYKNKYLGKRCFIIGNGPSLTVDDLETLYKHNELSFGVNKIFCIYKDTEWRPDFHIIADKCMVEENLKVIEALDTKNIFIAINGVKVQNPNVQRYYYSTAFNWSKAGCISEDASRVVYGGGTITFSVIQFAIYMGFKEIYLLGNDFNYGIIGQVGNHFYKEEDKNSGIFLEERSLSVFRVAKEYAEAHGIKIYNATRGGRLEVFERVDFNTLF